MNGLRVTLCLASWRPSPNEYAVGIIRPFLNALCQANETYLRRFDPLIRRKTGKGIPDLLESGIYYKREPPGREEWQDIPTTLLRGHGDCEDLACFMVAQLRYRGVKGARPIIKAQFPIREDGRLFHILVGVGDERIDPSRLLGM